MRSGGLSTDICGDAAVVDSLRVDAIDCFWLNFDGTVWRLDSSFFIFTRLLSTGELVPTLDAGLEPGPECWRVDTAADIGNYAVKCRWGARGVGANAAKLIGRRRGGLSASHGGCAWGGDDGGSSGDLWRVSNAEGKVSCAPVLFATASGGRQPAVRGRLLSLNDALSATRTTAGVAGAGCATTCRILGGVEGVAVGFEAESWGGRGVFGGL